MIETQYAEERPIRVVLVDDHVLVREGLREILSVEPDLEVVGEAADSEQALAEIGLHKPDVALLDVEIPGIGATDTVRAIRSISPATRVLILSMYDGPQLLRRLLSVGICGYLLKSVDRHELVAAIRAVYYAPQRVVLSVSRESLAQAQGTSDAVLSAREIEVLALVSQALSNGQVASRLHITEATVKRHLRNVFAKLGAVSRIDAVNKAIAGSLIESPRDQLESSQGSARSHRVL
ncbi:MAG TPA: response regulator transcription factor [Actinocrinis sp.]|nr:response regulator transcription factor [Actinocrinis sp.]